ncbi:aliphatic sulfonate ABC transporter substrate-binding protein [Consotaella salsifontis]|uniref:NitT/TauT family transport system substrate-binding protein n=1 Tax=Consotaella salsifontis TaxID=1365950 RepID=A0A1T4TFI9_9HYPH|nr:aliphatic sulfonate ABC transporter substrate-binding protein [Consotaella salsifontis]SKA39210.1 NitT/TauT family transport system substrate-binding protein [Consotaella salsifontis]
MQIISKVLISIVTAGTLMATSASFAADTHVRVGYIADYFGTSMVAVAKHLDLFKKNGLDAELKVFTNGPIQIQALGAGSLDYAYIGPGALWLPATGKAKVIAMNALGETDRVISRPEIKTIKDLAGKKIGVPEGTSGDMVLRLALEKNGMSLKDVKMVPMDPSTVVTAFGSGQVDGAGIWYPFVQVIRDHLGDINELAGNADFFPEVSFPSVFVAGNDAVKDAETVDKMIKVIREAIDYRKEHPEESVQITAKFLGVDPAPLLAESKNARILSAEEFDALVKDGSVDKWLDKLASLYEQFGKIKDPQPASEFFLADAYLKAAQ